MEDDRKNNFEDFSDQDLEDNEDVISLSDYISVRSNLEPEVYTSTDHGLFNFFTGLAPICDITAKNNSIDLQEDELMNEYSKRSKSVYEHTHVFPMAAEAERAIKEANRRNRSESMRNLSYYNNNSVTNSQYKNQITAKVNFTAITSMSDKSRRRMFMFGPVKFKPEMDIESIRKRQGRHGHGPMQIPPMPEEKEARQELTVNYGNDTAGKGGVAARAASSLSYRPKFALALARSLGCISNAAL